MNLCSLCPLFLFITLWVAPAHAAIMKLQRPPSLAQILEQRRSQRLLARIGTKTKQVEQEPETDTESEADEHTESETQLGELAEAFSHVLVGQGLSRDIDTVRLVQACRKFEGIMRGVGQSQAARDMEGNIKKVEALFYSAPTHRQRATMSNLLAFEKSQGIHGQHLRDPSGAIGFLWLRRGLAFQSRMYGLVLDQNLEPKEAAMQAYKKELQPYHGWTVQRLYSLALKRNDLTREKMLAKLGGFSVDDFGEREEQVTKKELHHLLTVWRPLISRWKVIFANLDMEDHRRV